ncbi:YrhK family protein [Fictibacillus enclensis]|uniref:YrhK family protein n=1 Tax=Fictibacillus enclensis TaxID=1017270 RepID=UPI0024C0E33D|nr:YrhK family protein [Fictibacillus enclensis]MDM5340879.1 YrhK family protein [Fictibacillus enclensis]WHY72300.1 YrhK family protein [Fictibacillus enclensis]
MPRLKNKEDYLNLEIGNYEVWVRKRYKILYTLNDFMIGLWFLAGSILFLFESAKTVGAWLFIVGSLQLIMRPAISLANDLHVKRQNERLNRSKRENR